MGPALAASVGPGLRPLSENSGRGPSWRSVDWQEHVALAELECPCPVTLSLRQIPPSLLDAWLDTGANGGSVSPAQDSLHPSGSFRGSLGLCPHLFQPSPCRTGQPALPSPHMQVQTRACASMWGHLEGTNLHLTLGASKGLGRVQKLRHPATSFPSS